MSDNGDSPRTDPLGALEAPGPEVRLFLSYVNPLGFVSAVGEVGKGLATNPTGAATALRDFLGDLVETAVATGARTFGLAVDGPMAIPPKDRRFADPTWLQNPAYFLVLQSYLLVARTLRDLVEAGGVEGSAGLKADFLAEQVINAAAPSNTPLNPAAVKRAFETGGASLVRGLRNFVVDVATNDGYPKQVERSAFTMGENIAATPGKVVFRNELMELIQYAPQTETVHEIPLLCSPPWINKYYIMDLAPGRSFIEWAVKHGHTTFAISYRNPDETLRDKSIEDYLVYGPLLALERIEAITGSKRVNIVALCLGGTLATMTLARVAESDPERVSSATLLNTIVDFSEPGVLGTFTDEATIERVETIEAKTGLQSATDMKSTFTLLRSNDLVWNYVVNNWLLGEGPPPFDILVWNDDATRMPAAMHSFILRSCYQRNDFAHGHLTVDGTRLDPQSIANDVYILSAIEDHIAPWRTAYATTRLLSAANPRFVLSSAGHIAGIVNPPNPKSSYWTNDELPADPDEWLRGATKHQGTWWEDWTEWIEQRSGDLRAPPPLGLDGEWPLGKAPGVYVLER